MSPTPAKPVPSPEGLNADWYAWCGRGELRFQRCAGCGRWRHPPRYVCAGCGSGDWSWERSAGEGTVFTWTVTHQALHPAFADDVPYAVVVVELAEGVRVVSGLRGVDPVELRLGLAVAVEFERRTEDITLPVFGPAR